MSEGGGCRTHNVIRRVGGSILNFHQPVMLTPWIIADPGCQHLGRVGMIANLGDKVSRVIADSRGALQSTMDHHYESSGDEEVLEEKVVAVAQRVRVLHRITGV